MTLSIHKKLQKTAYYAEAGFTKLTGYLLNRWHSRKKVAIDNSINRYSSKITLEDDKKLTNLENSGATYGIKLD